MTYKDDAAQVIREALFNRTGVHGILDALDGENMLRTDEDTNNGRELRELKATIPGIESNAVNLALNNLDLTPIVDKVARKISGPNWGDMPTLQRYYVKNDVTPVVASVIDAIQEQLA